jgi:hypothetical protein
MQDTQIEKSDPRSLASQTIEMVVSQDFIARASRLELVNVNLTVVLLPDTVEPAKISKLADVGKLGGEITVDGSFRMSTAESIIHHQPAPKSRMAPKGLETAQTQTQTPTKSQECKTGSICNQDSQVNAPQTINVDRSENAVKVIGNGPMSDIVIEDATIAGTRTDNDAGTLVQLHSEPGRAIHGAYIGDIHMCNLHSWDDFLDCVASDPSRVNYHAESMRTALVKGLAEHKIDPQIAVRCVALFDDSVSRLLANQSNESVTIADQRTRRPFCIKARQP